MRKKSGFTLIEVLAVIVIIGIVALIAVPSVMNYLNSASDSAYTTYEKTMESAAKNKVIKCLTDNENCDIEIESAQKIYLESLIEDGLLENMKDPNSSDFCEAYQSYVNITGNSPADYQYEACLYCGEYVTDRAICTGFTEDSENPVCGTVTGESARWTNINRSISVACTDAGSGCTQREFSKTFTKTTPNGKGTITIRDNSGRVQTCEVNAYVDKEIPTCEIEIEGDQVEEMGWYSLNAVGKIKNIQDADSGVLTYGIGTSVNTKDYNKNESITVGNGITTIVGYVKDLAGNEGVCTKEVKVGTNIPIFNLYYGYQIGLSDKNVEYININRNNNSLTTTTNGGTIKINNIAKYSNIEKVKITLSSGIETGTNATLIYGTNAQNGVMSQGSKNIEFNLEKGTYDNISIKLGTIANKTYNIEKIELLTKEKDIWTNKDVTLYVDAIDKGMKTTEVSFDNGNTWTTTFNKTYNVTTTGNVVTKNGLDMKSNSQDFSIKIDKTVPTLTFKAEKNDGTEVATDTYVNSGLNYTLTEATTGTSGAVIYYCKDTNNTCTPDIKATSGTKITGYNTTTNDYYIRYIIVSNAGADDGVKSFKAKFDTEKPVCNITGNATIECTDSLSKVSEWYYGTTNTSSGTYNTETPTNSLSKNAKDKVTSAGTYYLYAKDIAGNISSVKSATYYKVTYDKNSGTTNPTKASDIIRSGSAADLSPTATKKGYSFVGWNTSKTATAKLSSYTVTENTTLYAIYKECGNGYYNNNSTTCTACSAGTYGNGKTTEATQAAACSDCENGYYCAGGSSHTKCPAGKVGNGKTKQSTEAGACSACPKGYYCTGGTKKTACPKGTYRSSTGGKTENDCKSCPSGQTTDGTGSTSSSDCKAESSGGGAHCPYVCVSRCPSGYTGRTDGGCESSKPYTCCN